MLCPPCVRNQHEHCYNVQLAPSTGDENGPWCDCPQHQLTAEQHREEFTGSLYLWLERNGVTFSDVDGSMPPFQATLDLNKLKVGMAELIRAFGGEYS